MKRSATERVSANGNARTRGLHENSGRRTLEEGHETKEEARNCKSLMTWKTQQDTPSAITYANCCKKSNFIDSVKNIVHFPPIVYIAQHEIYLAGYEEA